MNKSRWQHLKNRNDDSVWKFVMMSVWTSRNDDSAWKVVMMTVYEQIMMTAYEEIVRISGVPLYCNARSNTDNPAFNPCSGKRLVLFSESCRLALGHTGGRVGSFPGTKLPGRDHSTPPSLIPSRCEKGKIYTYFHVRTRAVCSAANLYTLQVAKSR
jgi:hypothetical protein